MSIARREAVWLVVCLGAVVASGCKCNEAEPAAHEAEAQAAAPDEGGSEPPEGDPFASASRCEPVGQGSGFAIRAPSVATEESEGGVDQPDAVEVGGVAVRASGFAVAALRQEMGRTEALVALTDQETVRGEIVSLGRVHGAAEPPRLVAQGDRVIAAVADSDASGPTLRLARFDAGAPQTTLAWGAEFPQGRDESGAFSLAVSRTVAKGLVAWDDYDRAAGHSVVRAVLFDLEAWGETLGARTLSEVGEDADAPVLAPRPGGYWIAWLSHGPSASAAPGGSPDGNGRAQAEEGDGEALIESLPSRLRIAQLDEQGGVVSPPLFVTPSASQVVVFDLLAGSEGGVWLAWRDEQRAPGASETALVTAFVGADGTIREHHVEPTGLGAGMAVLLEDTAPSPSEASVWLAAPGTEGEVYVGRLTATGLSDFDREPLLLAKQALVSGHGRVLFAEPKGRDVRLGVVRCEQRAPDSSKALGSPPAPPSGSPARGE